MRIAYVGLNSGTSLHRANALRRIGHTVDVFDPSAHLPRKGYLWKFHYETGGMFIGKEIGAKTWEAMAPHDFDVVWVDHGRFIGPEFVRECRSAGLKTVVLNIDDPFGTRDRYSWKLFRKTIPEYDLVVVFRELNVPEAKALGAKEVMRIMMCADEVAHAPRQITAVNVRKYSSDVLFVGTWMPGRDEFLLRLVEHGVPLSIVGDRWQMAKEWNSLVPYWRSPGVYNDDEYATWIQCSKICIGLLSEGNRDMHTTRSTEIPMIGSLLCAERTPEHGAMYVEGEEAVFWSDADECARQCVALLADEPRRLAITEAGQERVFKNGFLNERVMGAVLDRLAGNPVEDVRTSWTNLK